MKKSFVFILLLGLLTGGITVNAQTRFYLGGEAGYHTSWPTTDSDARVYAYTISPDLGIQIGRKYMVGVRLYHSAITSKSDAKLTIAGISITSSDGLSAFGVKPYARVRCFDIHKIGVWLEGSVLYEEAYNKRKNVQVSLGKIGFMPLITYEVTKHLVLYSSLNLLSLDFSYLNLYIEDLEEINREEYSFGFNVDATKFFKMSDFSLGLIFRF